MSAPSPKQTAKGRRPHTIEPASSQKDIHDNAASETEPVYSEQIAALAYSYWEARGRQEGTAELDWLQAEQQLRAARG